MTRLTKRHIKAFASSTIDQLKAEFDAIERNPNCRTINGRFVQRKWAKYGDRILTEIARRHVNSIK